MSIRLSVRSKYLLQKNDLDSAAILIEQALDLDPQNYIAYNNRAYLKFKENKISNEIISDYKKALEINPNYDIAIYSLANYYFDIEDYQNTIEGIDQLMKLPIKELDSNLIKHAYFIKGQSHETLAQYDKAIETFLKILLHDPSDANAHKSLADCYFYDHKIFEAIGEYTKAIEIDSNLYQAYLGRASCFENCYPEITDLAIKDYNEALNINPNLKDYYFTNSPLLQSARKRIGVKVDTKYTAHDQYMIINSIIEKQWSQQMLIDKTTAILLKLKTNSNVSINYINELKELVKLAKLENTRSITKLQRVIEMDTSINYKAKTLNYEKLFQKILENEYNQLEVILLSDLGNKFEKSATLFKGKFSELKQAEFQFNEAAKEFKKKYILN
ncbi:Tetratricopeptide repeat protein [compost metagenome]